MTEHVPTPHLTDPTVLVTLTGADQSGVSTRLFEQLSGFEIEVIDVEQLIVRGRLVLSALVTVPADVATFEQTMRTVGEEFGLEVELEQGTGDNRPRRVGRGQVTLLGHPLRPAAMAAITQRITDAGGNIDRILRLARYPVTALRLEVSGADPDVLQSDLAAAAYEHGVDIAVEERGILRHAQRLVVMDVDSTLIQGEVIEMLAEHAGCVAGGRADHRGGDARRSRLRGVAARPGGPAQGPRRLRARRGAGVAGVHARVPARWCGRSSGWATGSRW